MRQPVRAWNMWQACTVFIYIYIAMFLEYISVLGGTAVPLKTWHSQVLGDEHPHFLRVYSVPHLSQRDLDLPVFFSLSSVVCSIRSVKHLRVG